MVRLVSPVVVGAAVIYAVGQNSLFGPLAWTLLAIHLTGTFAFARSNILDTGSCLLLVFMAYGLAGISEYHHGLTTYPPAWIPIVITFVIYCLLSLTGRFRAARLPDQRSVSTTQVVAAFAILLAAILVCGSSKELAGFLLVPGMIVVPVILLASLFGGAKSDT